jgi:hypothetical protein
MTSGGYLRGPNDNYDGGLAPAITTGDGLVYETLSFDALRRSYRLLSPMGHVVVMTIEQIYELCREKGQR